MVTDMAADEASTELPIPALKWLALAALTVQTIYQIAASSRPIAMRRWPFRHENQDWQFPTKEPAILLVSSTPVAT